jgi:cbb3-type cytochrome oxidase maturation protein
MEIMFLLVGVSVVLLVAIGWAFWWAVGSGQFEDLERAGQDILLDDDQP